MRIAQIAPLYESVPPRRYGGTERIVAYLTEELVRLGHEVTLFASGDSSTSGTLVSTLPAPLPRNPTALDSAAYHVLLLEEVWRRARTFDVLHFHLDALHLPMSRRLSIPSITTMHGRMDLPVLSALFGSFPETPVVSISGAQRTPLPKLRWQATVPHGLPRSLYQLERGPGRYLAFIGRICADKGPDRAIAIARRAGLPLRIAAKLDDEGRDYFERCVRPLLNEPGVEFVGEIGESEKQEFLGHAIATLFPIEWPEPFGLVMIESMACGTPVIAFSRGAVPEVVDDGVSGFVVDDLAGAVQACMKVTDLDRRRVREQFERRFSVDRMAEQYLRVYRALQKRPRANGAHREFAW